MAERKTVKSRKGARRKLTYGSQARSAKYSAGRSMVRVSRGLGGSTTGWPRERWATLRYQSFPGNVATDVNGFATMSFRLNSVHDPDFSGAGHQPMGFDEYSAIYQQYTVTTCKAIVGSSCNSPMQIIMSPAVPATAATSGTTEMERSGAVTTLINPTTGNTGQICATYDVARVFGMTREKLMNANAFSGTPAASPSSSCYLNISCAALVPAVVAWYPSITLEYRVKFWDPKLLAQS